MGLLGPNIQKLMAAQDVDGLRAALRHHDTEVRRKAARALGWIELPPGAAERDNLRYQWENRFGTTRRVKLPPMAGGRQGIVPQEAVADLEACWREGEFSRLLVEDALEAMARIGGPAGVEGVIRAIAELQRHREFQTREHDLLHKLGVDELIGIMRDEARPRDLQVDAHVALKYPPRIGVRLKNESLPLWTPEETPRAQQAAAEWDLRQDERRAKEQTEKEERAAVAAAWEERLRRFMASAEPSAEEAAHLLAWAYDLSPYPGGGFIKVEAPARLVRQIGQRLDEYGGFRLMREAHALFSVLRPAMARNLEMVWDGIGTWSG